MLITWKEEYNTGIKIVDDQHQVLIDIINEVYEITQNYENIDINVFREDVKVLLERLAIYAEEHFGLEEGYFDKFDYELKEHHTKDHDFFRKKISELKKMHSDNEIKACFELVDYLEDWFLGHITGEDRKYIDLFKKHGVS